MTIHDVNTSLTHHDLQNLKLFFLNFWPLKFNILKFFKLVDRWKNTFEMKTRKSASEKRCGIFYHFHNYFS